MTDPRIPQHGEVVAHGCDEGDMDDVELDGQWVELWNNELGVAERYYLDAAHTEREIEWLRAPWN